MGIEGTHLNIVKVIYDKPTVNIILSGEKLKASPLRPGIRQWCPLPPLIFIIVLEIPSYSREETEIKGIQIRKEVKLSLLADDIIQYIEITCISMKNQKEKLRNHSHSPLQQKESNTRNKLT